MGKDARSPFDLLSAVALEESAHVVDTALATAREILDMEVSYLAEFDREEGEQRFARVDGDAAAFALEEGMRVALERSYCQKMVRGELPNVVADAAKHPLLGDLELTRRGGIGSYVGVPVRFSDGSVHGTLCCLSKATDPEVADRDVRFMQVLARLVADELEREALRRETDRLKDDFLALTSHELRTPLGAIAGFVQILREEEADGLSEEGRQFLDAADRNAQRLLRLVDQLLFVARAQADRLGAELTECDLADVVMEAVAGRERVVLDLAPVEVAGDRDQLVRLVENLVSNALKYSPDGGDVRVRVAPVGEDAVVLEVADEGIGIPADEQERLFERFFRASTAHERRISGVGLGLWIVADVVERHGGEVTVRSAPGEGTTFVVTLPRARR